MKLLSESGKRPPAVRTLPDSLRDITQDIFFTFFPASSIWACLASYASYFRVVTVWLYTSDNLLMPYLELVSQ